MQKNNLAIILSGGKGERFDSNKPKQFFKINQKTIIENSVDKFVNSKLFVKIIIVSHYKFINQTKELFNDRSIKIIEGGQTRQESVFNGLKEAKKFKPSYVLIHDSVRPFFSENIINIILEKLNSFDAVIPSINVYDSIRYSNKIDYRDLPRKNLKLIQTPQGYEFNSILEAHNKFKNQKFTDDSMIFYKSKKKIKLINGEFSNFKITTKEDLKLGKSLYKGQNSMNNIRVGTGFDVHKFKKGKFIKIFGVKIPFDKSLEGHSDADVAFHSIVDAILGALCLGDIGNHFPPSDNKWKNKSSVFFMKYAKDLLIKENFKINNLDITLICENPKVSKYKNDFINSVSQALNLKKELINIKGTTTEKLGFLGREEGVACQVSVTISKDEY